MLRKITLCALVLLAFQSAPAAKEVVVDSTLAVVNSRVITLSEIQEAIRPQSKALARQFRGKELSRKLTELLIRELIRRKNEILFIDEAERALDERTKQYVDKLVEQEVKKKAAQAGSMTAFNRKLKHEGVKLEELKKELRTQKLVDILLYRKIYSKIKVTPRRIRDYYEKHKDEFAKSESAAIQHIFIPSTGENDLRGGRATALKVHSELRAGASFTALAHKWSEGPKAAEGGLWESVERGTLVKEVDRVIFSLAPNALSPIIKSRVGYHIVRVIELHPARTLTFEETQADIAAKLRRQMAAKLRDEYLKEIEKRSYVRMRVKPPEGR